mgnify:CR=1 FL=1
MFGCFRLRLKSSKRSAAAVAAWESSGIAVGEAAGRMIVRRTSVLPSQTSVFTVCTVVKPLALPPDFSPPAR